MSGAEPPPPGEPIHLDLRGLRCPMPVLRVRKALAGLPAGQAVVVACDDPLAALDIPQFYRESGNKPLIGAV